MLVLKVAAEATEDTEIRFAALVHDLGKGVSPKNKLPKHHDHEEKGAPIIKEMCSRLHVPNKYRDLAVIVSECHLKHHRVFEMTHQSILKLLKRVDAFRKHERFHKFLEVCKADHRGRVCEDVDMRYAEYPQEDYLIACRKGISEIDVLKILSENYSQERFIQELHRLRLNEIKRVKREFKDKGF
jgi:tRNA nucleotidyltransferase (CCA-adding enzyme)